MATTPLRQPTAVAAFRAVKDCPWAVFWFAAALAASVTLAVFRSEHITWTNTALALATGWLGLAPGFVYLLRRDRPPMPFVALTGLFYAVFFAFPVLFFDPALWQLIPDETGIGYGLGIDSIAVEAQLLVLAGLALMLAVFYLARAPLARALPHLRLPRRYSTGRLRLLLWALLAANFAWYAAPVLKTIPSIGQFLQPVGALAVGMLLVLWRQRRLPRLETGALLVLVIPAILVRIIASGLLTELILFCGFLMVVLFYVRFRRFWLLGVAPVLILLALYPALQEFRTLTWYGKLPRSDNLTRAEMVIDLAAATWLRDDRATFRKKFSPIIRRIARIVLFSNVVARTPGEVPFLGGESYRPVFTSFVPRLLWPGKPEERFGQAFGHRYRILRPDDRVTSVNVPWIVEMYANFGRPGVLVGMTLAGLFLALLSAVFNRREMSALEFVTGAAIIFPLAYPASNFSVMVGSVVPLTLALWLYFRIGLSVPLPVPGRRRG